MLELNHKLYEIYGEENKSVTIKNPKETSLLINDEPNGATLHDVFKIDDLDENEISGWSLLEYYKVQDGYLCDNEGNRLCFMEGDTKIFFKRVKKPLVILNEKEVSLEYVKGVSSLLGLNIIEETITGLSSSEKELLVAERQEENSRLEEERAVKAKEKKRIEDEEALRKEQERQEQEKEQQQIRLQKEAEEAEAKKQEEIAAIAAEEKRKQEEEETKKQQQAKEEEEAKKRENYMNAKQFRDLKNGYKATGYTVYNTEDEKYFFFYNPEEEGDDRAFLVIRHKNQKAQKESEKYLYEELEGEFDDDSSEFSFTEEGEDKVVVLDKEGNKIQVEIIA